MDYYSEITGDNPQEAQSWQRTVLNYEQSSKVLTEACWNSSYIPVLTQPHLELAWYTSRWVLNVNGNEGTNQAPHRILK